MPLKEIVNSFIDFVSKVLTNASLWFWLMVAAISLHVADSIRIVPLEEITTKLSTGIKAIIILLVCLWLNALSMHEPLNEYLLKIKVAFQEWRRNKRLASRVPQAAPETLKDLLAIKCLERRWLLWFIMESEKTNISLSYGTVLHGDEFRGAWSLLNLGLLNRTGDKNIALVFFHKDLEKLFYSTIKDPVLSEEIAEENEVIKKNGRESLKENLPLYEIESFFRKSGIT